MPEAPMELVDDVGLGTVPVHGVAGVWHLVLVAPASRILDVVAHSRGTQKPSSRVHSCRLCSGCSNLGMASGICTDSTI